MCTPRLGGMCEWRVGLPDGTVGSRSSELSDMSGVMRTYCPGLAVGTIDIVVLVAGKFHTSFASDFPIIEHVTEVSNPAALFRRAM